MMTGKMVVMIVVASMSIGNALAQDELQEKLAGKVVCIDPGHPSETSRGTRGERVTENHVNWVIGMALRRQLECYGSAVIMTKDREDELVTNRRRAEIANENMANLMVRLHCDAGNGSGFRIFFPDQQGKRFGVKGPSKKVIKESTRVAVTFHAAMKKSLAKSLSSLGVAGDSETYVGKKQGALTGSIFSEVPVLTVEMCVLTNSKDEEFISSPRGTAMMVQALTDGCLAVLAP